MVWLLLGLVILDRTRVRLALTQAKFPEHVENLTYDFVDTEQGMVQLRTAAGVKSPVEISAQILNTLRERAEASRKS